ncbi:39S ribosomal protein S18a, mitochondrial-like [Paramacrobiotus metropolitanus]|uniref:39S ribosomal protein S18a, mitochondrial-like n=1 Tax=Paramacrobiotus metropolitanus TaxID=2943436 RepID=UPI0024461756|nr:39S ribosomal protein S18a, mitochondrial-like [Paramacrobiotus metropolitanus]
MFSIAAVCTRAIRTGQTMTCSLPKRIQDSWRYFSVTPCHSVMEIRETKKEGETEIEGVLVDHFTDSVQLKADNKTGCCCLCNLNLDLKYHDVLIISQFLHPTRGTMLPRRVTGLCYEQQRLVDTLAYQAGKAGLLKKVFLKSRGTKMIMPKKPGHSLPRHYNSWN